MKMIKKILFIGWLLGLESVAGLAQTAQTCNAILAPVLNSPIGSISSTTSAALASGDWVLAAKSVDLKTLTVTPGTTSFKPPVNIFVRPGEVLTINSLSVLSGVNIIVSVGGTLQFSSTTILPVFLTIHNFGRVNFVGDLTLNGLFQNAPYSELDASKSTLQITGLGQLVNNGVVLLNDLKIETTSSPVICVGVNSCITTNTFSQNTVSNAIQTNFSSPTNFGNINVKGDVLVSTKIQITSSSNIKVCLGLKNTANWGTAIVLEGCASSAFCSKGLTELIDPNPVSAQTICPGAVPKPIKYLPATGGDGVNYFYQWQSSTDAKTWGNVKGNPDDYAPPALNLTTYIRRIVTSVLSDTSNVHTISILPAFNPKNNVISSGGAVYCDFGQVNVAGSDVYTLEGLGRNIVRYNWLKYNSKLKTWESLDINTMSYDARASALYRRTVASNGRCNVDTSAFVEVGSGNRFVVKNTLDDIKNPTCGMLRFALNAASELPDLNEITFGLPNSPNSILLEGGLTISSNVKIVGPGKELLAIDGNGRSNIFNFYSRQVTTARLEAVDTITSISGLTLKGATGGALNFNSAASSLVLKKCDFVSNTSTAGAGLNFLGVNLMMDTCTFDGNRLANAGNGGGANIQASGNVLIRNSKFLNNTGATNGGGVYLNGSFANAKILNSSFYKNVALNNGGGLGIDPEVTRQTDIFYSTFSTNNAAIGGAINSNGALFIYNTTIVGNTAKSVGGVAFVSGKGALKNVIAANNAPVGNDINGVVATSSGNNFIGSSTLKIWQTSDSVGTATASSLPKLFALDTITYTYKPIIGSPVIDKGGVYTGISDFDQSGRKRQGLTVDIGSMEGDPYNPPVGFSTCSNTATLNATRPLGYSGQWRTTSTSIKITDSKNPTTDIIFPSTTKADTAILIWDLYSDINTKTPAISTTIKVIRKEIPAAPVVTTPVYECLGVIPTKALKINDSTKTDTLLWYSAAFPKGTISIIPATTKVDSIPYSVTRIAKGCESAKSTIYVSTKALPKTDFTVTGGIFCSNATNSSVSVVGSEKGFLYQAFKGTKPIGAAITGTGANIVVSLPITSLPVGDTIINFKVSNAGCLNIPLTNTAKVTKNDTANTKLSVSATSPICVNGTSTITIKNAQKGVVYDIFNGTLKVGSVTGTGVDASVSISFTQAGTNTLTFQASVPNCKVVNLVNKAVVVVNASPDISLPVTGTAAICVYNPAKLTIKSAQEGVSYQLFDGTVAILGPQTVKVNGDSLVFTILNLTQGTHVLSVKATIASCATVTLANKLTVTVKPLPTIVGTKSTLSVCVGDSIRLKAASFSGAGYIWAGPNRFSSQSQNPKIAGASKIHAGDYTVNYSLNGCSGASDVITVKIDTLPKASLTYAGTAFCANAPKALPTSKNIGTVKYVSSSGLSLSDSTGEIDFIKSTAGTYSVSSTVTNAAGCKAGASFSLTVIARPAKPVINYACVATGSNVNLSTQYSGNTEQYAHKWFLNADSIANTSIYTAAKSGTYKVLVKYNNKCISDTSNGVNPFNNASKINITYGKTPFCAGDSIKLSSIALKGNSWRLDNGKIDTAKTVTVKTAGTMVLTITGGNCPGKDSLVIEVTPLPAQPAIAGPDSMCLGQTVLLSTATAKGFQWIKDNFALSNATGSTLIVSDTGTYRVKITSNDCSNTSTPKVIRFKKMPVPPRLNTTGSQTLCEGNALSLSIQNYISTQDQWYFAGKNINNPKASLSATTAGNYKVLRTTTGGCTAVSDSVILNVKICANAGRDTSICASVYKLNATPNANYQTAWRVVSGKGVFSDSTATATVSGLASGVNKFVWLLKSNGVIVSRDTVQISSTKANAGLDRKVFVDTVNLKGNVVRGATSTWRKISSTTIISTNASFNAKLSVGNNLFEYSLTVPNVCISKDSVLVKYVIKDTANAGDDIYACTDNATLGATKPKTGNQGKWTFVNKKAHTINIANDTLFNSKISGITVAKDTLLWTVTSLVDNTIFSVDTLIIYNAKVTVTITKPSTAQNVAVTQKSVVLSAKVISSLRPISNWNMNNNSIEVDSLNPFVLTQKVNGFKVFVNNEFCSAEDSLTITLVDTTKAYAGVDQEIYVDSTLSTAFQPVKGYHGIWSKLGTSSVFIVNDTLFNTKLKNIPFGKTTLVWTLTSPLDIQTKDTIVINRVPLKILSTVIQPVCTQANGKVLISLSPKNGIDTFTGDLVRDSTSGLLPKTYKVRIFRNGKPVKDTSFVLKAVNPYKLTLSSKDTSFCAGGSPVLIKGKLSPSASATYKWSGPKTSFADSIIASDSGKYVLSVTVSGCVLKDSVKVRVISAPKANAGLDRKVVADTVNLKGNAVQGATPAWRKIPSTTTFANTANANVRIALGLNIFEYSLTVPKNCTNRDSVRITYAIKDTARAGNDIFACVDSASLQARKPKTANKGKWTFVGKNSGALTIANDTLFNSKISGISAGNGVLLWTVTSLIDSTTRSVDTLKIFNAKVTVTITKPTSAPDIALTQKTISLAETVVSAFPAASTWYRNDTLQTIVPSTFTKNVTVFKVKVANKYCWASDSLTVTLVDTTKAYAGPNQEIYVDSTLSGALKPANEYKGTWSKETTSPIVIVDKNVYNTKFKNIPFGTSTLVWTLVSPNGVTTRDTLVIVRKKLTVEAVVTQPVCTQANGTISIQIKELSNYLDTFVGDTLKGATTIGLSPKSYKVRIFRNGKPVKDTSFVLKAVNPYKLTLSSKDTSFCTGLSLTLKGKITPSIFATYEWSGPKISSVDSVIVSDSGKYVLTTTASGCVLKDSVKVRLFPSPKAFAGNDTLTCQATAKLKAGSLKQGEKGTWSKLFGTSILSATNIPNPTVTFLSKYDSTKGKETNRFVWSVSDQNQRCTTYDTVDVYYAVVLISVEDDTSGIAGQEIALKVTQNDKYALGDKLEVTPLNTKIGAGQPILAYDVQDLTVVFKTNPRYYVKEPYRFGYIISNACQARDTGYVVLNKTYNVPPTANTFTKATQSGSVYNFVLKFSDVDKNPNIKSIEIVPSDPKLRGIPYAEMSSDSMEALLRIDYSAIPDFEGEDRLLLRVCDVEPDGEPNCKIQTFIISVIKINPDLGLTFYNGLSKNEDQKNEVFFIENAEKFPKNNLKILNRWGDVVYSADKYDNKDIAFDGGTLPDGTYYFFFDPGNGEKIQKGFIILKR